MAAAAAMACRISAVITIIILFALLSSSAAAAAARAEGEEGGEDLQLQAATVKVDASPSTGRNIPETLFGVFFEEINHAGTGGLWAELVSNRGFEAHINNTPTIDPWSIIGDESSLHLTTDRVSCFPKNVVALRMEVLCEECPPGGVGIYNPGFWGMNIEGGNAYRLVMYVKSTEPAELTVQLTSSDGLQILASATISVSGTSTWTKLEQKLVAKDTNRTSRLQITTSKKGILWFDQVSLMPADTYKGHGFRTELIAMLVDLKPRFMRFPGGCFVEGNWLRNAFRWKETIGPWEERPGHYGDVWNYWTDDGLGFYEFLLLAEDLGALPVWVFNAGISHNDGLDMIAPFVEVYTDKTAEFFLAKNQFDKTSRSGPRVFISEYAVRDGHNGSLLASLAEAAFLTGVERNSDYIQLVSYAPLFVNEKDRTWSPDAIVFNTWQQYGTPSYWMQTFFRESSGAVIHPVTITSTYSDSLAASAITWQDTEKSFLRVKIVNFGSSAVNLGIRVTGLQAGVNTKRSRVTVLTSGNALDQNSFSKPNNIVPVSKGLPNAAEAMHTLLSPFSFTSFDLALGD